MRESSHSAVVTFSALKGLGDRSFVPASLRARRSSHNGLFTFGLFTAFLCFVAVGTIVGTISFNDEPTSISDPLREIRLAVRRMNKQQFLSSLSIEKQRELARKVSFVSDIIGQNSRVKSARDLALSIVSQSVKANVDPLLITAVVKSESTFNSEALSSKGARGLMQLLPSTAEFTKRALLEQDPSRLKSKRSLNHAEYNLSLGIEYFKHLEKMFKGNRELALIAYNWGPGNLSSALRDNSHIPAETREYAKKIIKNHSRWTKELRASNGTFAGINLSSIG